MGKGEIARYYKFMSPADQRTFDRWLKANAIVGLILTIGNRCYGYQWIQST